MKETFENSIQGVVSIKNSSIFAIPLANGAFVSNFE